jgi:hypothetical protein
MQGIAVHRDFSACALSPRLSIALDKNLRIAGEESARVVRYPFTTAMTHLMYVWRVENFA